MKCFMDRRQWSRLAITVALICGCSKSGPQIVRVSGTVTHGGQPVDRLEVVFDPDNGRPSVGRTDADGHYVLDYNRERKGALVGMHKVWVKYVQRSPVDEGNAEINAILQKYGDRRTTPLTVEVKEEGQEIPLELD